jgi:CelD/BcsL family acetyltransferase involved in cellulose biosynthesis
VALGRMWVLKIGFDEAFARCSPGFHLTCEALRHACDRGVRAYEFLGSAEPWEMRWRPEPRAYKLIVVYPVTARGLVGAVRDAAGVMWRRATCVRRPPKGRPAP